jgi:hypothetical protein
MLPDASLFIDSIIYCKNPKLEHVKQYEIDLYSETLCML